MAETIPGGRYKVGDKWQDANGEKVSAPGKNDAGATTESGGSQPPATDRLSGVQFASAAARTAAEEAGMNAADFKGAKASSADGYTKPDVVAIIEAQDGSEQG